MPALGEGWIPAFIQGGSLLIVAYVVFAVIGKHLPSQVKAYTDAIMARDQAAQSVATSFLETTQKLQEIFAKELETERQTHHDGMNELSKAIERQNRLLLFLIARANGGKLPEDLKAVLEA